MTVIKPISDSRNYDRLLARLELYQKLGQAELEARRRGGRATHRAMMKKLRMRRG